MEANKMKNMIVLKNLPSNLIDEAFVVLKPNKKIKMQDYAEKTSTDKEVKTKFGSKNYMIKEAEMVINNYLSDMEKNKQAKSLSIKELESRYKKLKLLAYLLGIVVVLNMICMFI